MSVLSLRPLASGDAELYLDLYCSSDTMAYIAPALPRARALASFHAALALPPHPGCGPRRWVGLCGESAVALLACDPCASSHMGQALPCSIQDRRIRGSRQQTDFLQPARAPAALEIGALVLPEARRRGYARESLRRLIHHTQLTGVDHWRMQINRQNEPMLQLAAGLGFRHVPGCSAGPHWQCWEAHLSQLTVQSRG